MFGVSSVLNIALVKFTLKIFKVVMEVMRQTRFGTLLIFDTLKPLT